MRIFFKKLTLVSLFGFMTYGITSCGSRGAVGKKSSKKTAVSSDASAETTSLSIYGDECQANSIVTVVNGGAGRAALEITGASSATHSIGYRSDLSNVYVSFDEVVVRAMNLASGTVEVVLRDRSACLAAGGTAQDCELNGGKVLTSNSSVDITSKISFVMSGALNQYSNSSNIGNGQDGLISDLVNGEGLIGGLAQALGGGGDGGLLGGVFGGGLGKVIGSGDQARQNDATTGQITSGGGCIGSPAASSGDSATDISDTSDE